MTSRALVWLPLIFAGAFVLAWAAAPDSSREVVLVVEIELAKGLGLLGFAAAAFAFQSGDHLRRAWLLLGACTLLLFTRDVFVLAAQPGPADVAATVVEGVLATGGNAASVAGTYMLARTWSLSGLEPPGRGAGGWMLIAGAIAAACLATAWPLMTDVRELGAGHTAAIVPLVSDLGDGAVLALLGPLSRTALALRGGVLRWPWALLMVGGCLWLVFDVAYAGLALAHVEPGTRHLVLETLRALPTLYGCSAGLSQCGALYRS